MENKIIKVDPKTLITLEKNARYMRHEVFQRIVDNIRKDNALTSVPYCAIKGYYTEKDKEAKKQNKIEVISGNHRVMAAVEAGLEEIDIMLESGPMTIKQRVAKQLSHNELVGEDDPALLYELYKSLDDIEMMQDSGIDDSRFDNIEKINSSGISEMHLNYKEVSFMFLPSDVEDLTKIIREIEKLIMSDKVLYARLEEYREFIQMLTELGVTTNTKSVATQMRVLIEMYKKQRKKITAEVIENKRPNVKAIPLNMVLEMDTVSIETAKIITKALKKTTGKGTKGSENCLVEVCKNYVENG